MSKTLQYMTSIPHRPREMRSNTVTQLSDQTNWLWNYVYVRVIRLHFFHNARVTPFVHFSHAYICTPRHTSSKEDAGGTKKYAYVPICSSVLHPFNASVMTAYVAQTPPPHPSPLHLILYVVSYSQSSCQMCVWASYGSFWQRITHTRSRLTQIQPLTSAPVRRRRMLCIIHTHTQTQKTFSWNCARLCTPAVENHARVE